MRDSGFIKENGLNLKIVEEHVVEFRNGVRGSFSSLFQLGNLEFGKVVEISVRQAHKDLQYRTISGHKSNAIVEGNSAKEYIISNSIDEIKKYFNGEIKDFNTLISNVKKYFINSFNAQRLSKEANLQGYGKAQKLVNMTMKYMYCFDNIRKEYREMFVKCYMPIDSIILQWYFDCREDNEFCKNCSWSYLSDNNFINFQNIITNYSLEKDDIENYPSKVLNVEFIVWKEYRLKRNQNP